MHYLILYKLPDGTVLHHENGATCAVTPHRNKARKKDCNNHTEASEWLSRVEMNFRNAWHLNVCFDGSDTLYRHRPCFKGYTLEEITLSLTEF